MNWLSLLGLDSTLARWRSTALEGAAAAEDRWDLARLEFHAHKNRVLKIVVLALAMAVMTIIMLILVSAAIVVQYWDTSDRILVAWCVAGAWVVVWLITLASIWSLVQRVKQPFALTRRVLAQDWNDMKERL